MLYRKCNRCGKELPRNLQARTPSIKWVTIIGYDPNGRNVWQADLCATCNQQVRDFANRYRDEEWDSYDVSRASNSLD